MAGAFTPREALRIIAGLMLVNFLGALEQTIVSVSLPEISRQLGGVSLLSWVVSGYLVASTVATPVYGKLGDLYGRRRILAAALTIFLLASVACALARSMPALVFARILQGIGGGGLISTSQAIIGEVVPLRDRGRYQGYISVVYAIANVGGPALSGYLTHYLSWHWIFWINLPLGLAALAISGRALRNLPVPGVRLPIDYAGIALLSAGLSALLIAITLLGQGSASPAAETMPLLATSAILIAVFLWHEGRTVEPIIPLALFRIPAVWMGCGILFLGFFQIISLSVLVPLGMQTLDGVAPGPAALHLIAFSLAVPAGAFAGGRMMLQSGHYRHLQIGGTGLLAIAAFCLSGLGPHSSMPVSLVLALSGFSIGLTLPTSLVAVQHAVPSRHIGVATAMVGLFRTMGGAFGVTLLTSLLFALLRHGDTSAFAFRMCFLASALVACLAHLLAWMIPGVSLAQQEAHS
jgi:EmrB/QacA subfamily drug resistance transporter